MDDPYALAATWNNSCERGDLRDGLSDVSIAVQMTIFRDNTPGRTRGRALQRMRAEAFARNPLCHGPDSECEKLGRVRQWVTRDHINPMFKQGIDHESNCQYLCAECDYSKTNRDLGRRDKVAIGIDGWPIK